MTRHKSKRTITTGIEETVQSLHLFVEPKLSSVCAFLAGYDAAFGGAALLGLHEWLAVKKIKGLGVAHWAQNLTTLVRHLAGRSATEVELVDRARELLAEFFAYRRRYGIAKISSEYMEWRQRELQRTAQSRPDKP
jgi:hypothetical protein